MPPDMQDMRIPMLAAAAAVLLAACNTVQPTAVPASSAGTTTAPPTTTTSSSPTPVHDRWKPKFETARGPASSATVCAPLVVQSQECAKYLTRIVLVATDLQAELKGKPAYAKTYELVRQVVDAGSAFGNERCREGAGTFEMCQAHVVGVLIGSLSVTASLEAEDLAAP